MPRYHVETIACRVGGLDYHIRQLSDLRQFHDPDGVALGRGISSANWPLFGRLWPAAVVLAQAMAIWPLHGQRILEFGCGLGLASLVLHGRGADITASDHHPLAAEFLAHNVLLNLMAPLRYVHSDWSELEPRLHSESSLGRFDLLIASDVLYERGHAQMLALFLAHHALPRAQIVVTDPGRRQGAAWLHCMREQGYAVREQRCAFASDERAPFRGRLLHLQREAP